MTQEKTPAATEVTTSAQNSAILAATFVEIKWDIFVGADGSSLDAGGYTTIHKRY